MSNTTSSTLVSPFPSISPADPQWNPSISQVSLSRTVHSESSVSVPADEAQSPPFPDSTEDLIVNQSLLLENNFDNINAIDWEKGCYVGQEITARMKYRALLKKSLRSIKIDSGNIQIGDLISLNNKNIGKITSISNDIGLAMLKIEDADKAKKHNNLLTTTYGKIRIIN